MGWVLLDGVVGSTAYGLAGPDSDIDRLGVFAAPTLAFHGLRRPRESIVSTGPDRTLHEAGKFAALCLGGNPTVMELLWLEEYETRTELGDQLVAIRTAFLSAPRVRAAYLGYAVQQFRRLEVRGDGSFSADTRKRTAGRLTIRLPNPQWYIDFGERVAASDLDEARFQLHEPEVEFPAARTPLPDQPDEAQVERWLHTVRDAHLPAPERDLGLTVTQAAEGDF
jgi:hypothetical protein